MKASSTSLQSRTLMVAQGREHHAYAAKPPLSLKCMFNGAARYHIDRSDFRVDDGRYLILNQDQPYRIDISSPTRVESFIVWFPEGWAEDAWRAIITPTTALLDQPVASGEPPVRFFELTVPHDDLVSPAVARLRSAHLAGPIEDGVLEEALRELLVRMFCAHRDLQRQAVRVPAARAATREELWRRLNRARDYLQAEVSASVSLEEAGRVAGMSSYHFLRSFRAVFGATPHAYHVRRRLEHAAFLLARTTMPVTEICFAAGFESLGSFSSLFRRVLGVSPRDWRRREGTRHEIRNSGEVFSGTIG